MLLEPRFAFSSNCTIQEHGINDVCMKCIFLSASKLLELLHNQNNTEHCYARLIVRWSMDTGGLPFTVNLMFLHQPKPHSTQTYINTFSFSLENATQVIQSAMAERNRQSFSRKHLYPQVTHS